MTIKTYTTVENVTEVATFPAFFKFGCSYYAKAISDKCVITIQEGISGCSVDMNTYLTCNDWQPATDTEFYEAAARVMQRIGEGVNIIPLEIEGGAYAD